MYAFNLKAEQAFDPRKHVERVLGKTGGGDVTIACWEPGQASPYHCHPDATEIYFCFEGGGTMRTPNETIALGPGTFVVHPPGELHEYVNGPKRTLLFRVRYGGRCRAGPRNGRAIRTGGHARKTSTTSDGTRWASVPRQVHAYLRTLLRHRSNRAPKDCDCCFCVRGLG